MASAVKSDRGTPEIAKSPTAVSPLIDAVVGVATRFPDLTRVLVAIAAGASADTLPVASPLVHSLVVAAASIGTYVGWLYATSPTAKVAPGGKERQVVVAAGWPGGLTVPMSGFGSPPGHPLAPRGAAEPYAPVTLFPLPARWVPASVDYSEIIAGGDATIDIQVVANPDGTIGIFGKKPHPQSPSADR